MPLALRDEKITCQLIHSLFMEREWEFMEWEWEFMEWEKRNGVNTKNYGKTEYTESQRKEGQERQRDL